MGTLLWDFDGTLATRPLMWSTACAAALERAGHPVPQPAVKEAMRRCRLPWHRHDRPHPELNDPEAWWSAVLAEIRAVVADLAPDCSATDAVLAEIRTDLTDPLAYRLFDDVHAALDLADQSGLRSAVLSNHVPELSAILEGLGICDRFDWVITSGLVGFEKPHAKIFELAIERAGDDDVWMIGDNAEADCHGAVAAGLRAILVRRTGEAFEPAAAGAVEAVTHVLATR